MAEKIAFPFVGLSASGVIVYDVGAPHSVLIQLANHQLPGSDIRKITPQRMARLRQIATSYLVENGSDDPRAEEPDLFAFIAGLESYVAPSEGSI